MEAVVIPPAFFGLVAEENPETDPGPGEASQFPQLMQIIRSAPAP